MVALVGAAGLDIEDPDQKVGDVVGPRGEADRLPVEELQGSAAECVGVGGMRVAVGDRQRRGVIELPQPSDRAFDPVAVAE